jgi:hypothetical protein
MKKFCLFDIYVPLVILRAPVHHSLTILAVGLHQTAQDHSYYDQIWSLWLNQTAMISPHIFFCLIKSDCHGLSVWARLFFFYYFYPSFHSASLVVLIFPFEFNHLILFLLFCFVPNLIKKMIIKHKKYNNNFNFISFKSINYLFIIKLD